MKILPKIERYSKFWR